MPKQKELTGMEAPTIKEIEDAADAYVKVRDSRMRLTEKEIAAKANLLQVVLKHESELSVNSEGDRIYTFDEEVVILKPGKRNVKVKAIRAAEDDENDDD